MIILVLKCFLKFDFLRPDEHLGCLSGILEHVFIFQQLLSELFFGSFLSFLLLKVSFFIIFIELVFDELLMLIRDDGIS